MITNKKWITLPILVMVSTLSKAAPMTELPQPSPTISATATISSQITDLLTSRSSGWSVTPTPMATPLPEPSQLIAVSDYTSSTEQLEILTRQCGDFDQGIVITSEDGFTAGLQRLKELAGSRSMKALMVLDNNLNYVINAPVDFPPDYSLTICNFDFIRNQIPDIYNDLSSYSGQQPYSGRSPDELLDPGSGAEFLDTGMITATSPDGNTKPLIMLMFPNAVTFKGVVLDGTHWAGGPLIKSVRHTNGENICLLGSRLISGSRTGPMLDLVDYERLISERSVFINNSPEPAIVHRKPNHFVILGSVFYLNNSGTAIHMEQPLLTRYPEASIIKTVFYGNTQYRPVAISLKDTRSGNNLSTRIRFNRFHPEGLSAAIKLEGQNIIQGYQNNWSSNRPPCIGGASQIKPEYFWTVSFSRDGIRCPIMPFPTEVIPVATDHSPATTPVANTTTEPDSGYAVRAWNVLTYLTVAFISYQLSMKVLN